jgi:hypothetical protein
VEEFVDERRDAASMTDPKPAGKPELEIVAYAPRNAHPADVDKVIQSQFAGRFRLVGRDDRNSMIFVEADKETQAEIHDVIKILDKAAEPRLTPGSEMAAAEVQQESRAKQIQQEHLAFRERIRALRQRLSESSSQEEKAAARERLRKLLTEVFDQDMQMRKKQATEIESRLAKLRQQYEARQKARDKIVSLQIQVIEADAAGLGFPGSQSSATPPTAGAHFPGGFSSTPPTSNRSGHDLPGSTSRRDPSDPPNFGSGWSRPNVPTSRADQHDSIPQERTLEETKKARPAEVAEMKKRGHFIQSTDGSVFAYANIHQRSSSSHIRVVDSATGKLVGAATVGSIVGPLEFTDEGVASREADGVLELRVPLNPRDPQPDPVRGATDSVLDQIKLLGLKLGHEMKTSLDTRYPMRIMGKVGEVAIKAGETKLIQLPKPTMAVQWQCGDFKPESVDDVEPFDYLSVEWKPNGHVIWSCYRSPATSTPQAGTLNSDGDAGVVRGPNNTVATPIERTVEALTQALTKSNGITVAIGSRNILLPMPQSADANIVAKEILSAIGEDKRIELLLASDGVLIQTPQHDLEQSDLRDASRITIAIIEALAK